MGRPIITDAERKYLSKMQVIMERAMHLMFLSLKPF